jgi:L-2-hydroxyglutarate oxidase LhgO
MHPGFWEIDAMLDADFIVAGGGVAGLQTALELRARRPHDRIMVLERGLVPAGASAIAFRAASIISTAVFIIFATSTSACCWAAGAISILRRKPRLKQR